MLRAVLTRRYEIQPSGSSKASLLTSDVIQRILDLHREGKGPVEIAGLLGVTRKQVARVIAEAQPAAEEGPKPIPCPRRPKPNEIFKKKPGDTA